MVGDLTRVFKVMRGLLSVNHLKLVLVLVLVVSVTDWGPVVFPADEGPPQPL